MPSSSLLQLAEETEVRWLGQQSIARLGGGSPVVIGRHGLAILDLFTEPRSLQDALDSFAARAHSVLGLAEIMSVILRLQEASILTSPDDVRRSRAMFGFAAPAAHINMLDDRTRTQAFLEAISRTVASGDVVVDLGTGTGVLAIAAARAGARQVYAIETTPIAEAAAAMFAASGYGERITLVRGWSTDVNLPERADVLVSETLGDDPWEEGLVHLIADARRRLLVPNARIVPSFVRWVGQPVAIPDSHQRRLRFSTAAAEQWTDWYGIEFRSLVGGSLMRTPVTRVAARTVAVWPRPSDPVTLAALDLRHVSELPRFGEAPAITRADGVVDGIVLYWEADLASGVVLSTSPFAVNPVTSWLSHLVPAPSSRRVKPGDILNLYVTFGRSPELRLDVHDGPQQPVERRP